MKGASPRLIRLAAAPLFLLLLALSGPGAAAGSASLAPPTRVPMSPSGWHAAPAEGVALTIGAARGPEGKTALGLEWDFHGHGGWAAARHPMKLDLGSDYEVRFALKGSGPANELEVKLEDRSGENVWRYVRPASGWPAKWTEVRIKKRQLPFAWGPRGGGVLEHLGAIEFAVTAGDGGRGSVEIADLEIVPLEPPGPPAGPPEASADRALPGHRAALAVDGNPLTAWRPGKKGGSLTVDLRGLIELGGLTLEWEKGASPESAKVELSRDGKHFHLVREVEPRGAPESDLRLPDAEARRVRVSLDAADCAGTGTGCGLAEVVVQPLSFGAGPNAFFEALAKHAPRGSYPRGFSGQAVYWTVVGLDGGSANGLISEDGALEVGKGGFSLEPFVETGGKLATWASIEAKQSLADGYLPIPTVTWQLPGLSLEVTPLAAGIDKASYLLVRYRLRNDSSRREQGKLVLAARPFQVDPPVQFLNQSGGYSPIHRIECRPDRLVVDGRYPVVVSPAPDGCGVQRFDWGRLVARLKEGKLPAASKVEDPVKAASGALAWSFDLAPGRALEVVATAPLVPAAAGPASAAARQGAAGFDATEAVVARLWRARLGHVKFGVGTRASVLQAAIATLRSSLAWDLIERDGPALRPGTRSYARSWIRDGAFIATALLENGQTVPARAYAEWYAPYQYANGAVPCCVDRRGSDPVVENDSHGELIHLIYQVYRFTRDRAFAERLFPHVEKAVDYIEKLSKSERTAAYRAGAKRDFFGLLPASISHEGYSAHPVHSYWDDLFAYRGLADGADLAAALGHHDLAQRWGQWRDRFRADLLASIAAVRKKDHLAYIPGSAELGDFDSTATTAMLDPGGLLPYLPRKAVDSTFERYWREWRARQSGKKKWDAYTPYEIRHIGAFVRLGWRRRADELLAGFLADRRPRGWNQWPEVVTRERRAVRFLGDMPHGWVAADFVRSLIDLFAYEERDREALVIGAGIAPRWIEATGVSIDHLPTPWGELGYRLLRHGAGVRYEIDA
ncbi:MAG TPA: discoidin domain-containing protein, partial [Thermoanaerobaculia bacterium]|nr:discoidin domain-containing protein [Thermoanaerobaculia bacterium]